MYEVEGIVWLAEDGLATEDDEDDTDLPPAEIHAEPASTAEAAQQAAQVAGEVRQAELRERSRLEEDAIGEHLCLSGSHCFLSALRPILT